MFTKKCKWKSQGDYGQTGKATATHASGYTERLLLSRTFPRASFLCIVLKSLLHKEHIVLSLQMTMIPCGELMMSRVHLMSSLILSGKPQLIPDLRHTAATWWGSHPSTDSGLQRCRSDHVPASAWRCDAAPLWVFSMQCTLQFHIFTVVSCLSCKRTEAVPQGPQNPSAHSHNHILLSG